MSSTPILEKPWGETADAVLKALETPEDGLNEDTVRKRRDDHGPNQLKAARQRSAWDILLDQIKNPIVALLAAAAGLSFFFDQWLDGGAIIAVIVINMIIGFVIELKATRSMESLRKLAQVNAKVRRARGVKEIPARDLVVGDRVIIEAGDKVTADLRVIESQRLRADEAALTGESTPVSKKTGAVDPEAPIAERACMLFKGTAVTGGSGEGVVTAVGMDTELGRISTLTDEAEAEQTPFEKRLLSLAYRLIGVTIGIAVTLAVSGLIKGGDMFLMIETTIALAVAAIPEGLPIVATIALARGMRRMARHNAIVNRLAAVQTLGSTSVICADKTGTLTENRMTVTRLALAGDGDVRVAGETSENPFTQEDRAVNPEDNDALREMLEVGILCNNAALNTESPEDREKAVGDPVEVALLVAGARAGYYREALLERMPEEREAPFDPEAMMMATYHRHVSGRHVSDRHEPGRDESGRDESDRHESERESGPAAESSPVGSSPVGSSPAGASSAGASGDGPPAKISENGLLVAVKGAPEAIMAACDRIRTEDGDAPFDDESHEKWRARNNEMAEAGLRVLGMARKHADNADADPFANLTFLGLAGMLDPPRDDVSDVIKSCRQAGIRVVMVTGDQALTARNIGERLGLLDDGQGADYGGDAEAVVHGSDLKDPEALSDERRRQLIRTPIFARVSPRQKLDLITMHQRNGAIVAMTGDGINDAPALKKADIGVAMGQRGTQVAREAADIILKDDSFRTILVAVEQGRAIFENIRRFILYMLSGNVGQMMIVAAAILAGAPLPLLPLQILYLNMIGDVFPALALSVCEGDPNNMRRPPRSAAESILTRGHWIAIAGYGAVFTVAVLGAFALALLVFEMDQGAAVTVSFLTLAFARLWHVFNMRERGGGIFRNTVTRNPWIWGALGLCAGLLLLGVYLPGLSDVLKMTPPTFRAWALIIGASLIPLLAGQIWLSLPRHIKPEAAG